MKVFVDIDALCRDIAFEEFLTRIWFSKNSVNLRAIPYNNHTLSIINDLYKDNEIVILANEKMLKYSTIIINNLTEDFKWQVEFKYYNSFAEKINLIEKESAFITNNVLQPEIYEKTKENSFSGSFIGSWFFTFLVPNKKENRDSFLQGLIMIPFEYLQILIPLFACWPVLISHNIPINKERIIMTITGTILTCSFAAILREILEVPNERYHYMNGFDPICSKNFIKYNYSPKFAFAYAIGFAILFIIVLYKNIFCGLSSLINGLVFFLTYLMTDTLRIPLNLIGIFLTTILLTQNNFIKYFLGMI